MVAAGGGEMADIFTCAIFRIRIMKVYQKMYLRKRRYTDMTAETMGFQAEVKQLLHLVFTPFVYQLFSFFESV